DSPLPSYRELRFRWSGRAIRPRGADRPIRHRLRGPSGELATPSGADVTGAPAAELHGPLQRGGQGLLSVCSSQSENLADLAGQAGDPVRGGTGQERGRGFAEGQELLLGGGPGTRSPAWLVRPR